LIETDRARIARELRYVVGGYQNAIPYGNPAVMEHETL
jgi:hypothetical protein